MQDDNTLAALHMQKALELAPDSAEYASDLDRLLRRIPDKHVDALQVNSPFWHVVPNIAWSDYRSSEQTPFGI